MLDTRNVLLSYRKSYFWSPLVILPYLKYLWNVSFAVFTPFPYMVRISNSRLQLELDIRNALLSYRKSYIRSHLVNIGLAHISREGVVIFTLPYSKNYILTEMTRKTFIKKNMIVN